MRQLLASLVLIAALSAGNALAQSGYWAGLNGGYPGGYIHFGVKRAVANLDVRAHLGYGFFGFLEIGASALYPVPVDTGDVPIDVYVGGGPSIAFVTLGWASGTLIGVEAFGGLEYRFGDAGVFFEFGPRYWAYRSPIVGLGIGGLIPMGRLGFNWRF